MLHVCDFVRAMFFIANFSALVTFVTGSDRSVLPLDVLYSLPKICGKTLKDRQGPAKLPYSKTFFRIKTNDLLGVNFLRILQDGSFLAPANPAPVHQPLCVSHLSRWINVRSRGCGFLSDDWSRQIEPDKKWQHFSSLSTFPSTLVLCLSLV